MGGRGQPTVGRTESGGKLRVLPAWRCSKQNHVVVGHRFCVDLVGACDEHQTAANNAGVVGGFFFFFRENRACNPSYCFTMVSSHQQAFLQICGHDLAKTYPKQFGKMIDYFARIYVPQLDKTDVDALSRLQTLLVDERCRNPPAGADYGRK